MSHAPCIAAALLAASCGGTSRQADAGPDGGVACGPAIVCSGALTGALQEAVIDCQLQGGTGFTNHTGRYEGIEFQGRSARAEFSASYQKTGFQGVSLQLSVAVDGGSNFNADAGTVAISTSCCSCPDGTDCKLQSTCVFHGTLDAQLAPADGGLADAGVRLQLSY